MSTLIESLLGCSRNTFAEQVWEKRYFHGSGKTERFQELFGLEMGAHSLAEFADADIAKGGTHLSAEVFENREPAPGERLAPITAVTPSSSVRGLMRMSLQRTIALHHVEAVVPELAQACLDLKHDLDIPAVVYATLWHGPPGALTQPHWDAKSGVIQLQLEGTKCWYLDKAPLDIIPDEATDASEIRIPDIDELTCIELQPGDALYVPSGIIHATRVEKCDSTSLSFFIEPIAFAQMFEQILITRNRSWYAFPPRLSSPELEPFIDERIAELESILAEEKASGYPSLRLELHKKMALPAAGIERAGGPDRGVRDPARDLGPDSVLTLSLGGLLVEVEREETVVNAIFAEVELAFDTPVGIEIFSFLSSTRGKFRISDLINHCEVSTSAAPGSAVDEVLGTVETLLSLGVLERIA